MPPSQKVISLLLKDSRNSSTHPFFFSSVKVLITIKKARNKVASAAQENKNMSGVFASNIFFLFRPGAVNLHPVFIIEI